jgi:hypothetical protein
MLFITLIEDVLRLVAKRVLQLEVKLKPEGNRVNEKISNKGILMRWALEKINLLWKSINFHSADVDDHKIQDKLEFYLFDVFVVRK